MVSRLLGYVLVGAGMFLVISVFYRNSPQSDAPLVYSPTQLLASTWLTYKERYLEAGTYRTVDTDRDNITTSEGQSYTMLRAVWMGDQETFDGAWTWTKNNIAHAHDHLFAWLWGRRADGSYGVLDAQNGQNSASDADTDIALSLLFAYARWQNPAYLSAAQGIMADIWDKEVITIRGVPYLVADDIEEKSAGARAVVNPSYFNPAAYRLFARADPLHPWNALTDSSYTLLRKSGSATLGQATTTGLPPDWIAIDKKTGVLSTVPGTSSDTNFGYDALRVPWRIALDWQWSRDVRAQMLLNRYAFLSAQWSSSGALASAYAHTGERVDAAESPAMYGGTLGYFLLANPAAADDIYRKKLLFLYNPGANTWREPLSYYDDNWTWFGIALYNNLLPNLASGLPGSALSTARIIR